MHLIDHDILVILDRKCNHDPGLIYPTEFFRVHNYTSFLNNGDCTCNWGELKNRLILVLYVQQWKALRPTVKENEAM